jgi:hypothetical protein
MLAGPMTRVATAALHVRFVLALDPLFELFHLPGDFRLDRFTGAPQPIPAGGQPLAVGDDCPRHASGSKPGRGGREVNGLRSGAIAVA